MPDATRAAFTDFAIDKFSFDDFTVPLYLCGWEVVPMENDDQYAGRMVRRLRDVTGMTIRDLADAMGISQPTLSLLERGGRRWTIPALKSAARALSVPVTDLMDLDESDTKAA